MGVPNRATLERLYRRFNDRDAIPPDPLELLYRYRDSRDQEVAGLIAALLAYGGVRQIVASAADALARMGPSPAEFVSSATPSRAGAAFAGFRHRWTRGDDLAALVCGLRSAIREQGSLQASFVSGLRTTDETVLPALENWVRILRTGGGGLARHDLLACPRQGSACKRLNLFLRWMVRKDGVDPGLWRGVPPSKLVVPLDLHMHRIAREWGLTCRKTADLKAALEVTAEFRKISPDDPVRYDFALTRASMRGEEVSGVGFQVSGKKSVRSLADT